MVASKRIDVCDAGGTLVGRVNVPELAARRLWKQSVRITWECLAPECVAAGIGEPQGAAWTKLAEHLRDTHGIEVCSTNLDEAG